MDDQPQPVTEVALYPPNDPSVLFDIGKRIAAPDDSANYWEIRHIEVVAMQPGFIRFGCAGPDLEGKWWGLENIFSGVYAIGFEPGRVQLSTEPDNSPSP
jgi:hypothetical protein